MSTASKPFPRTANDVRLVHDLAMQAGCLAISTKPVPSVVQHNTALMAFATLLVAEIEKRVAKKAKGAKQ